MEPFKRIIADFHGSPRSWGRVSRRDVEIPLDSGKAFVVTGPRRCGKTYLLYSAIERLERSVDKEKILYVNFEDERLDMGDTGFQAMLDAYQQLYPGLDLRACHFFFDEIQQVAGWEKFIRRLNDTVTNSIYITGSSAKCLGSEIATSLRGRAISHRLLPFSFREFLWYCEVDLEDRDSSKGRNLIAARFLDFLDWGGYPEVWACAAEMRLKILQSYLDIMLYRDVIERHQIKNVHVLKDFMKRLLSATARVFSVHKYLNDLKSRGIKIGKDSIYEFFEHFIDAHMVLVVERHDMSAAKRAGALKKVYVNDTGLANANRYMSSDKGWALESLVLLELAKREWEARYFVASRECDFVAFKDGGMKVIQACLEVNDDNRRREMEGAVAAAKTLGVKKAVIVSLYQDDKVKVDGVEIDIVPCWKWCLDLN